MRPGGKTLIARIIALIIRRHGGGIVVAPHQAGTFALLLDIPAHEFGATFRHRKWIFMALSRSHQRGAPAVSRHVLRSRPQCILIGRHEFADPIRPAFAAEQSSHTEATRQARGLVAAVGGPKR